MLTFTRMPTRLSLDHTRHRTTVTDHGLERYAHPETGIRVERIEVDRHVSIRAIVFTPPDSEERTPFVIVGGMSTVVESFRGVLVGLTRTHPVVYVETREKPSSRVEGPARFDLDAIAADVNAAVDTFGFESDGYVLVGYSLGAMAVVQGYVGLKRKPLCIALAEPVPVLRIPSWGLALVRFSVPVFPAARAFAKWYLRNFRIDAKEDVEIVRIMERALDTADPVKLRDTILSIAGRDTWDRLPSIDRPVLVVATSKDTLHVHSDITRMGELLPDCELIDMEDNTRTHSEEMAGILMDHAERIGRSADHRTTVR